ncbi:hypothetical protein ACFQPG_03115 [Sphingomonas sp. GCM10030256]|uniref:hypothetical protein n=1 Tax=Sphingomonas sp. GCM10030256 TaxID=3273427 RepID=UPI00360DFCED
MSSFALSNRLTVSRPGGFRHACPIGLHFRWILWLLGWRLAMRAGFTWRTYGWREGLSPIPRTLTSNLTAILATRRALAVHIAGGPRRWDKTAHTFPTELASR